MDPNLLPDWGFTHDSATGSETLTLNLRNSSTSPKKYTRVTSPLLFHFYWIFCDWRVVASWSHRHTHAQSNGLWFGWFMWSQMERLTAVFLFNGDGHPAYAYRKSLCFHFRGSASTLLLTPWRFYVPQRPPALPSHERIKAGGNNKKTIYIITLHPANRCGSFFSLLPIQMHMLAGVMILPLKATYTQVIRHWCCSAFRGEYIRLPAAIVTIIKSLLLLS